MTALGLHLCDVRETRRSEPATSEDAQNKT